jgi:tRNA dimethylallyltransferase
MKEIALIGPTACGKSALAIEIAKECNAFILSLDSLGIYKEIDIASAKPSKKEREEIRHFGIDVLYPNEYFNVAMFFDLYKNAKKEALTKGKNLIITGGSGFYLKAMIEGLSTTLKP